MTLRVTHMRNICSDKKKFKDHLFRWKMELGAPDGPILVQNKPCTELDWYVHKIGLNWATGVFSTILETQK